MEGNEDMYKILIIGDPDVGKSCILERFSEGTFTEENRTSIGVDFKVRTVEIAGKKINLQIWDTAGQERYKTITTAYFRGSQGIILVYDVSDRTSFQSIQFWLQEISTHANKNVNKILVGNKCDKTEEEREVDKTRGEELANILKAPHVEVSAKTAENIDKAFLCLAQLIKKRRDKEHSQELENSFVTLNSTQNDGHGCC